jgi:hypothetical protein
MKYFFEIRPWLTYLRKFCLAVLVSFETKRNQTRICAMQKQVLLLGRSKLCDAATIGRTAPWHGVANDALGPRAVLQLKFQDVQFHDRA